VKRCGTELDWVSIKAALPRPFVLVLVWVTGGRLHHGEDYPDVGVYDDRTKTFRVSCGDTDEAVPVSHWMEIEGPDQR